MNLKKYLFQVILLCNFTLVVFSQDSIIVVAEGSEAVICGHIVIVDALWMNEEFLKADISVLEKQNSKPITGGYKAGDEITISSKPGCTYYVYAVTKLGGTKNKGEVTISKTPPVSRIDLKKDVIKQEENNSYKFGKYVWYVSSIRNEGGNTIANITITQNTELVENLVLSKGDLVWLGEDLYKVESINAHSEFIKTDPEKIYEPLPGKIEFKAVKEYINEK
jgi:hypothetical protein